jgi:hypothetical protein
MTKLRILVVAVAALFALPASTTAADDSTRTATRVGPLALPAQAALLHSADTAGARSSPQKYLPGAQGARAFYGKLPLSFVPNAGQLDGRVRYSAQAGGASFFFTEHKVVVSLGTTSERVVLRLRFLGARPQAIAGRGRLEGTVNYLRGNDRSRWYRNLPTYSEVAYRDVWPGIDVVFRGDDGKLKYEFVLKPGARVSDVRLAYRGAERLTLARGGNLVVHTAGGSIVDTRPLSYQVTGGEREAVASRYVLAGSKRFGFAVGAYDASRTLVIDPGLVYSTFLGGSDEDSGDSVAVDPRGNAYVAGLTQSLDFPATTGAYDISYNGETDANFGGDTYVAKLNKDGTALVYATYLGGTSDEPYWGASIAVDPAGYAHVAGTTWSADFPTTPGAFDTTFNGGFYDAFVTKLTRDGSGLVYSTFVGGSSYEGPYYVDAIALDPRGNAYIGGFTNSTDFPTENAYDDSFNGPLDVFVTKLNPSGSALVYSTYLGGADDDDATGIAVDPNGEAFVVGYTASTDFPTENAFQPTNAGGYDAFVTRFDSSGSALVFSTYLGGSTGFFDFAAGVDVNYAGSAATAVVTGNTDSTDFPITPDAYDTSYNGSGPFCGDAFVTKLARDGTALQYSTYLGGTLDECVSNIAVDSKGRAHVVGFADSLNYPTTAGAVQPTNDGSYDVIVTKLNEDGTDLDYSTYLGGTLADYGTGIAVDWPRKVYVSGTTQSPGFDTTAGAYDTIYNGGGPWYGDAFVTKLDVGEKYTGPFASNAASVQAEQDAFAYLNELRTTALLPPLTLNTTSSSVARNHSGDQLIQGELTDRGSNGSTAADRLRAAGVLFTVNAESVGAAVAPVPSDALAAIESDLLTGLAVNALNPAFKQVGIGVVYVDGVMLLTADFTG